MASKKLYDLARNAERNNKSQEAVAEGLQLMAEAVEAQDKAIGSIAGAVRRGIDEVKSLSNHATEKAEGAFTMAHAHRDRLAEVEQWTVLQKFQWLFRGAWW